MALAAAGLLAATTLGGAYINARFGIGTDLRNLLDDRAMQKRVVERLSSLGGSPTLYSIFAQGDPAADALWFEGRTWSYRELKEDVDKFASLLRTDAHIGPGDFVALFTTNSPEMVVACLALSKLGAVAAMLNTNLRGETLAHSFSISRATFIISTPDLAPFVSFELPHLALCLYSFNDLKIPGDSAVITYVRKEASRWQSLEPDQTPPAVRTPEDIAFLIYTSGTTGKAKACAMRNWILLVTSTPLESDEANPGTYRPIRTYSSLPLFHGTAFLGGLCYTFGSSGCLCLRRKFSASNFWKDACESRANRIMYIGELCRYLLASPPTPYDKAHGVTHAYGNGLRRDIYVAFKERFNVPEIREFYRSTEGAAKFDSHGEGSFRAGTVGFQGPLMHRLENTTFIVKYDMESESPWRNPSTGFCEQAQLGEAGEAIGRVKDRNLLTEYLDNEKATSDKLMRDVFEKGDLFQRMGDLLLRDQDGWIRFADRIGDSFRWKGENVSAGEVRDHICKAPEVEDAVVYGVKLRSYDGQAGGAAIALKIKDQDTETRLMRNLHTFLRQRGVPTYAVPRFVRVTESISTGVTFKQAKGEAAKKSWSPLEREGDRDTLYWLNGSDYQPLEHQAWTSIESGVAKL